MNTNPHNVDDNAGGAIDGGAIEGGDDAGTSTDLGPVPRPGFKSRAKASYDEPAPRSLFSSMHVIAGAVRAAVGTVGFGAALLYLPSTIATPVLAGVSMLMMVTGTYAVWRETRDMPAFRFVPKVMAIALAVISVAAVVTVLVAGAGALGPFGQRARAREPNTVEFRSK